MVGARLPKKRLKKTFTGKANANSPLRAVTPCGANKTSGATSTPLISGNASAKQTEKFVKAVQIRRSPTIPARVNKNQTARKDGKGRYYQNGKSERTESNGTENGGLHS